MSQKQNNQPKKQPAVGTGLSDQDWKNVSNKDEDFDTTHEYKASLSMFSVKSKVNKLGGFFSFDDNVFFGFVIDDGKIAGLHAVERPEKK